MKKIALILSFISFSAFAAQLDIIGACSKKPVLSFQASDQFETVGDLTVHILTKNRIPFQGNERGMNSILNSPLGLDALEVLSDTQMRSYGWCFKVNGKVPEDFASEIYLKDGDHIEWFFSYAWYDKGWISMCNPAYEVKSTLFCK